MRGIGQKNRGQNGVDLAGVRRSFARWRRGRKLGARIPEHLWESAVSLVAVYGVSRTASELSLSYYSLKERVDNEAAISGDSSGTPSAAATFVEWTVPAVPHSPECVIEFENGTGSKMRVSLTGREAIDLPALSRSFFHG